MSTADAVLDPTTLQLEETMILEKLKPFRSATYDQYDILYAAHVKRMYTYVDDIIVLEFNKFTENLLDEKAITRNKLLNAIENFPYIYQYKINKDMNDGKDDTDMNDGNLDNKVNNKVDYTAWMRFTDEAFNFRPYQPCIIS